jgi:carbonic anhydrase
MSDLQVLLDRNQKFSAQYEAGLQGMPKLTTFVLTCSDARTDPAHFLGLDLGDALVFRNAGARITADIELELGILWTMAAQMMGSNFQGFSLVIIQHTDCGLERLANPDMAAALSNRLNIEPSQIKAMANADHAQRLHEDVEHLRQSSIVPKNLVVSGHIYNINDGSIQEVIAPTALAASE